MTSTTSTAPVLPDAQAPAQVVTRKGNVWIGAAVLIVLVLLVAEIDKWIGTTFKANGIASNPLEYPLTAVVIGLVFNGIFKLLNLRWLIKPALRTELFLKVGLVLLGATIVLGDVLKMGIGGLIQALIMVASVFLFTWWLSGRSWMTACAR
jgi:uncharacterized membrane protein YadS